VPRSPRWQVGSQSRPFVCFPPPSTPFSQRELRRVRSRACAIAKAITHPFTQPACHLHLPASPPATLLTPCTLKSYFFTNFVSGREKRRSKCFSLFGASVVLNKGWYKLPEIGFEQGFSELCFSMETERKVLWLVAKRKERKLAMIHFD
jgi:hypothetical protein